MTSEWLKRAKRDIFEEMTMLLSMDEEGYGPEVGLSCGSYVLLESPSIATGFIVRALQFEFGTMGCSQ